MEFSNWPTEWPESDDIVPSIRKAFETPRSLAPRQRLRLLWVIRPSSGWDLDDGTMFNGMPTDGTVSLSYSSDDPSTPQYFDQYDLLFNSSGQWPGSRTGTVLPTREMAESQISFARIGQAVAEHIAELRR